MGATVSYLLILQKYINPKQKILKYTLCLGNIPGDFSANNIEKQGLNGCAYDFSVDCRVFDTSNIIDIHKYLIKNYNIKQCLD